MNLVGQNANIFNDLIGVEVGEDMELEEAGEEEGAAEMRDELPDLVSTDGDEALVATVLAVFLLEHDAGDPPRFALLRRDVRPGLFARDREDRLVVLWVRPRKAFKVRQLLRLRRVEECGGGL